jgi:hypothetical protein
MSACINYTLFIFIFTFGAISSTRYEVMKRLFLKQTRSMERKASSMRSSKDKSSRDLPARTLKLNFVGRASVDVGWTFDTFFLYHFITQNHKARVAYYHLHPTSVARESVVNHSRLHVPSTSISVSFAHVNEA